jgi:hypothetical protein
MGAYYKEKDYAVYNPNRFLKDYSDYAEERRVNYDVPYWKSKKLKTEDGQTVLCNDNVGFGLNGELSPHVLTFDTEDQRYSRSPYVEKYYLSGCCGPDGATEGEYGVDHVIHRYDKNGLFHAPQMEFDDEYELANGQVLDADVPAVEIEAQGRYWSEEGYQQKSYRTLIGPNESYWMEYWHHGKPHRSMVDKKNGTCPAIYFEANNHYIWTEYWEEGRLWRLEAYTNLTSLLARGMEVLPKGLNPFVRNPNRRELPLVVNGAFNPLPTFPVVYGSPKLNSLRDERRQAAVDGIAA